MANINASGAIKAKINNDNYTIYPITRIANVDGLQTALDGKAAVNHTHSAFSTTSAGFVPAASSSGDTDKYLKGDGTWATPSGGGGAVSGVKGNDESTYRTGNVNLTCDNIGASPNDHSHGSIGRNGDISNDVTIANNDKLLIKDYSDSNRVKTSSISFDGSTTTQFLSKKGTWETPSGGGVTGVKGSNESTYRTGNVSLSYSNVGAASSSHTHSGYVPTSRTVNGYSLSSNVSLDYEDVGLKVSTQTLTLSSMSFTKSYGGVYYASSISPSTSYSQIFSITMNGFNNLPNMAFMPLVSNTNKIGLMVCAPAAPSSLSFSAGTIGITIVGI